MMVPIIVFFIACLVWSLSMPNEKSRWIENHNEHSYKLKVNFVLCDFLTYGVSKHALARLFKITKAIIRVGSLLDLFPMRKSTSIH